MPVIRQAIVGRGPKLADQDAFERKLLAIRKQTQNPLAELEKKHKLPGLPQLYMPSFSTRTVVYKGLLLAPQVGSFYEDLRNPLTESALALVHQRFSTNTFPSWKLAHPYRFIAHNGEINTVRGNVNWMYARRRTMESDLLGADLDKMWPLIPHGQSDTACLDNALELLVAGGYSLAHAMMMLIPEAWAGNPLMDAEARGLLRISRRADGAVGRPGRDRLHRRPPDRRHARPQRPAARALLRHRRRPCRHGLGSRRAADPRGEDRAQVAPAARQDAADRPRAGPHRRGRGAEAHARRGRALRRVAEGDAVQARGAAGAAETPAPRAVRTIRRRCSIASRPSATPRRTSSSSSSRWRRTATIRSARWAPTRRSPCSSNKPKLLYNYFKQNFAQVTNPPIDPIREELVMSLVSMIGPRPNLLGHHAGTHKRLEVAQPILTNADLEKIRSIEELLDGAFRTAHDRHAPGPRREGAAGLEKALDRHLLRGDRRGAGRPQHPDPVGPRRVGRRASRSRRCWRPRRCIIT